MPINSIFCLTMPTTDSLCSLRLPCHLPNIQCTIHSMYNNNKTFGRWVSNDVSRQKMALDSRYLQTYTHSVEVHAVILLSLRQGQSSATTLMTEEILSWIALFSKLEKVLKGEPKIIASLFLPSMPQLPRHSGHRWNQTQQERHKDRDEAQPMQFSAWSMRTLIDPDLSKA